MVRLENMSGNAIKPCLVLVVLHVHESICKLSSEVVN